MSLFCGRRLVPLQRSLRSGRCAPSFGRREVLTLSCLHTTTSGLTCGSRTTSNSVSLVSLGRGKISLPKYSFEPSVARGTKILTPLPPWGTTQGVEWSSRSQGTRTATARDPWRYPPPARTGEPDKPSPQCVRDSYPYAKVRGRPRCLLRSPTHS